MSEKKTEFRVLKYGYDRFAVDYQMEEYQIQIDALQKRIETLSIQNKELNDSYEDVAGKYNEVVEGLEGKQKAVEEMARIALREANQIVSTAHSNADAIVNEAIITARLILSEIEQVSRDASGMRAEMKQQVAGLLKVIEAFEVPQTPALKQVKQKQ